MTYEKYEAEMNKISKMFKSGKIDQVEAISRQRKLTERYVSMQNDIKKPRYQNPYLQKER